MMKSTLHRFQIEDLLSFLNESNVAMIMSYLEGGLPGIATAISFLSIWTSKT